MNIPKYINEKSNIIKLVSLTAIFALVFINIYKPFSSSSWYPVSDFKFFVFSSIIILTGVLVVIISRIIMYFYSRKHEISYRNYVIWVLCEILFMSLFYTIYTIFVNEDMDIMEVFKNSVKNTALVLLLPYSALWFYFGWIESKKRLEIIEQGEIDAAEYPKNISFLDDKGILRLSLQNSDLLYIESDDNYVVVHYTVNGREKKYLLRNTIKNLETMFASSTIGRCHRSYLVNFSRVKVIRREKEGLFLELDAEGVMNIPISKSYQEKVSEMFISQSFKNQK
ncbi:MAG: LytTR family transcriptional regulator DNA-binding domain-containing protein [Rikenellaceae bacterium]